MTANKYSLKTIWVAIGLLLLTAACKKDDGGKGPDEQPSKVTPVVRPQGASLGAAVTKQIGAEGGIIQSADKSITVTIPAGALTTATTVGIEPVSNTNVAGIGNAFRLTPHGQQFAKPVAIKVSWAAHADTIGLLATLGLAYQQQDGIWKFVGANNVDENLKTVTFNTTHFSDWVLMNKLSLAPYAAYLSEGEKQTVQAVLFTDEKIDDVFVPLPGAPTDPWKEPGYPVGFPIPLPAKYIQDWKLTGPGKLNKTNTSHVMQYVAPASVNAPVTATITLTLKAPVAGQYILVSTMMITGGDFIELSIGGGAPVTFPASPVVRKDNRYVLANPDNEGGGYFLLTWTDGIGIHPFDLSNTGTYFHFITPQTSYVSRYRPKENADLVPSGGSVNVTKVSDGRAEGTFNVTEAGYGPTLIPRTTAQGRFKVKLFN